jgi:hypothetical protein
MTRCNSIKITSPQDNNKVNTGRTLKTCSSNTNIVRNKKSLTKVIN